MKKTTFLLATLGAFTASASFASSSPVITVYLNTPDQQGYYVKANLNGHKAGVQCIGSGFAFVIENDAIPMDRALGVIKLGDNHLTFTQCNNASCSQTGKQAPILFTLSQLGSTYMALPSEFTVNFDGFGETCTDPDPKGHRLSFLS